MGEFITLIQKDCGHFGLVREKYAHSRVCCTQCELENADSVVSIVKKKFVVKHEVPILNFEELDGWISKQFEQD